MSAARWDSWTASPWTASERTSPAPRACRRSSTCLTPLPTSPRCVPRRACHPDSCSHSASSHSMNGLRQVLASAANTKRKRCLLRLLRGTVCTGATTEQPSRCKTLVCLCNVLSASYAAKVLLINRAPCRREAGFRGWRADHLICCCTDHGAAGQLGRHVPAVQHHEGGGAAWHQAGGGGVVPHVPPHLRRGKLPRVVQGACLCCSCVLI